MNHHEATQQRESDVTRLDQGPAGGRNVRDEVLRVFLARLGSPVAITSGASRRVDGQTSKADRWHVSESLDFVLTDRDKPLREWANLFAPARIDWWKLVNAGLRLHFYRGNDADAGRHTDAYPMPSLAIDRDVLRIRLRSADEAKLVLDHYGVGEPSQPLA